MTTIEQRALNQIIAETLFGWTNFSEVNGTLLALPPDSHRVRNIPPNYFEEEEASATLRDKLLEEFPVLEIRWSRLANLWSVGGYATRYPYNCVLHKDLKTALCLFAKAWIERQGK